MNELSVTDAQPLNRLLRMAVVAGVESAVRIHIDRGDDLNARDPSGMTPLMLCALRDRPAICELLLTAGADHDLLDPSGRTALQIAIEVGSNATAAILGSVGATILAIQPISITHGPEQTALRFASAVSSLAANVALPVVPEASTAPFEPDTPVASTEHGAAQLSVDVVDPIDDGEFDLSGWEAENEPTCPEVDFTVIQSASTVQTTITDYKPIDSSVEWDDIDAYLPEVALPLARADDAERRARLRLLLLRALREGSVPALDVQAQSTNEDRSANLVAEAYLAMVINDLGAEIDERNEYSSADESFEVFVDPKETPDEELALDEALVAIDRAASPRHEPLRIYQREFQGLRLLKAEEEVQLAKDMEAALEVALDALASWPEGIGRTLAAGADAIAGTRQLSSICVGGELDPEPALAEGLEASELAAEGSEDTAEDNGEPRNAELVDARDAGFADALRRLGALTEAEDARNASPQEIRHALAGLRLNRRFLLELNDAPHGSAPCPAFARAMASFRQHRDRMAATNLKLAFFQAKKYLYSGEPLDDLAQEGNIGLLEAVDRYDWRRGFRFSTYATWWVRQRISRYVADKARTIRVPVHIFEKLQRAERTIQAIETATGREPTFADLAGRMEMPPDKLAALMRIAPEPSSIDEGTIDGLIAIDSRDAYAWPDPADVVNEAQLKRAVDRFISELATKDRKEERILRLRFGVGVNDALTLDEIGTGFEVTRERIRQIEAKAIRKLQHPSRSEPFGRLVLGLRPKQGLLAQSAQRPSEDDEPATVETVPQAQPPKLQAAPRPRRESSEADDTLKPSALDQLLADAVELGVPVIDERMSDGSIWVQLLESRDKTHRRLIRKLLNFGFTFMLGKGYWK